jgi:hypothetical protein
MNIKKQEHAEVCAPSFNSDIILIDSMKTNLSKTSKLVLDIDIKNSLL